MILICVLWKIHICVSKSIFVFRNIEFAFSLICVLWKTHICVSQSIFVFCYLRFGNLCFEVLNLLFDTDLCFMENTYLCFKIYICVSKYWICFFTNLCFVENTYLCFTIYICVLLFAFWKFVFWSIKFAFWYWFVFYGKYIFVF